MPFQLQKDTDIYADYTITHTAGKKMEVVEPTQQISAGDFNVWCIENNMGVHYGKTHAFVVGSKHIMTSANGGISVTINEHSIESVSAKKHLGITIDKIWLGSDRLSWFVKTLVVNSHLWSFYQNRST